jgi:ADP-heptose:LPS heptosyltransferase
MLPNEQPYAVLLPGTNWATKRWPVERFAALVKPLQERFGLQPVVGGAACDLALGEQIGGINLAGRTSLRQVVALLERAAVVNANESGPMHIAAALGRPLVTLFGPTNPIRTGPFGRPESVLRLDLPCSPCYSRRCSHQSCLQWLQIAPVLKLAEQQMQHVGGRTINAGA